MTFTIAIISKNKYKPPNSLEELKNMTVNGIINEIKSFVEIKNVVNTDDMMLEVIKATRLNPVPKDNNITTDVKEQFGSFANCLEGYDAIYQIGYLDFKENDIKTTDDDVNGIASCLTIGKILINGNAVLLKSVYNNDYTCSTGSITIEEIASMLYKNFAHKGVLLEDDSWKIVDYYLSPTEILGEDVEYLEVPLYLHNLIICYKKTGEDYINKLGTQISGKYKLKGKLLLISKSTNTEFIDIDSDTFEMILCASAGPYWKRSLTKEETDEQTINNRRVIINRATLLKKRTTNLQNKCNRCEKTENLRKCTGCYRVYYDNSTCLKEDWDRHKDDCLNKIKPMN